MLYYSYTALIKLILLDNAEEVDVGVVDGEVDGDESCSPCDPEPLLELLDDGQRFVLERVEVLDGAGPAVRLQDSAVVGSLQVAGRAVAPSEECS